MTDAPGALLEYLQAQPSLVALVGRRIWAEATNPAAGYKPTQGAALCFAVRGGGPDYSDALLVPRVQFQCYGRDEDQAQALYRALYSVLHGTGGGAVQYARCDALGQQLADPETGWLFVLTYFRVWTL